MQRKAILGAGFTAVAAFTTSIALAAAIMNPLAAKQADGSVQLTWSPDPGTSAHVVDTYSVLSCGYLSQPDAKCKFIGEWPAVAGATDYSANVAAADIIQGSTPTLKVTSYDCHDQVVGCVKVHREHAEPFAAAADPTPSPVVKHHVFIPNVSR
jgi:hypothetical protein